MKTKRGELWDDVPQTRGGLFTLALFCLGFELLCLALPSIVEHRMSAPQRSLSAAILHSQSDRG